MRRTVHRLLAALLVLLTVSVAAKSPGVYHPAFLEQDARRSSAVPDNMLCVQEASDHTAGLIFYDPDTGLYNFAAYVRTGLRYDLVFGGTLPQLIESVLVLQNKTTGEWLCCSLNGLPRWDDGQSTTPFCSVEYRQNGKELAAGLQPGVPFVLLSETMPTFYGSDGSAFVPTAANKI